MAEAVLPSLICVWGAMALGQRWISQPAWTLVTDSLLALLTLKGARRHPEWAAAWLQSEVQTRSIPSLPLPLLWGWKPAFTSMQHMSTLGRAPCAVGTGVPRSFLDTSPSTQPQQSDLSALSQVHPCITTLLLIKTVFRDAAVCFETVSEYQPRRGEMKAKAMQSHLSIVPKTLWHLTVCKTCPAAQDI